MKFLAVLGNEFIINEILFSYFILLFKFVISGQDVTNILSLEAVAGNNLAIPLVELHDEDNADGGVEGDDAEN